MSQILGKNTNIINPRETELLTNQIIYQINSNKNQIQPSPISQEKVNEGYKDMKGSTNQKKLINNLNIMDIKNNSENNIKNGKNKNKEAPISNPNMTNGKITNIIDNNSNDQICLNQLNNQNNNENKYLNYNQINNYVKNDGNNKNRYMNNNISNNNDVNVFKNINIKSNNYVHNNIIINNQNRILNNYNMQNNLQNNKGQKSNNNKVPITQSEYSFSRYTKAPKTGLKLLGDTSYLNSVLQLIGNIRSIASYFLNPKNADYINNNIGNIPVSFVFHRFFLHLYPFPEKENRQIYKPETFLELLGDINKIYHTKNRRNPNELLFFILNILHNELKDKNNIKIICSDISDKNNVIKIESQNFAKNNNSIISNHFNWFEIKLLKCSKCGKNEYSLHSYNTFELNIMLTYQIKKQPIKINYCLEIYEKTTTHNSICKYCQKSTQFFMTSKIYSPSNIFIFSLDRKNLNQNFLKISFIIEEKIDITNFLEIKQGPQKNYNLIGILSYFQKENKYISFCMSPIDKQWYIYNDEDVELTNIITIINDHNIQKYYIPCILVYRSENI